jgi:hypothetical protein
MCATFDINQVFAMAGILWLEFALDCINFDTQ